MPTVLFAVIITLVFAAAPASAEKPGIDAEIIEARDVLDEAISRWSEPHLLGARAAFALPCPVDLSGARPRRS